MVDVDVSVEVEIMTTSSIALSDCADRLLVVLAVTASAELPGSPTVAVIRPFEDAMTAEIESDVAPKFSEGNVCEGLEIGSEARGTVELRRRLIFKPASDFE